MNRVSKTLILAVALIAIVTWFAWPSPEATPRHHSSSDASNDATSETTTAQRPKELVKKLWDTCFASVPPDMKKCARIQVRLEGIGRPALPALHEATHWRAPDGPGIPTQGAYRFFGKLLQSMIKSIESDGIARHVSDETDPNKSVDVPPVPNGRERPVDSDDLARQKIEGTRQLLETGSEKTKALTQLGKLILRKDISKALRDEADLLFNKLADHDGQLWLLGECDAYVGKYWSHDFATYELWCLSHAYLSMGEFARSRAKLEEAFRRIQQFEKSYDAINTSAQLAGWLYYYKQDEDAKRAIEMCAASIEGSDTAEKRYLYCHLGALCYLLGDFHSAEHYRELAAKGLYYRGYTDSMYFANSHRFKEAWHSVDQYWIPRNISIVALAAATAGKDEDYVKAKRMAIQKIPSFEKSGTGSQLGNRVNLLWADALAGNFAIAERKALDLSKQQAVKYQVACIMAREYALSGNVLKAQEWMQKARLVPQSVDAGLYLARAMARRGDQFADLYRYIRAAESESYKLTLSAGVVAGLNPSVPTREKKHIPAF